MKPQPLRIGYFLSFVLLLLGIVIGARNATSQEKGERFGMTEEEYRKFTEEAKRFGLTPEGLKSFIDRELGKPVLYDKKHKVVVSYHADADGTPTAIHIVPDPTGTESVTLTYRLSDKEARSAVTYSGTDVMSFDLNADGVFDQLFVTTDHNQSLKLDRGGYILLDGKWVSASRDGEMPKNVWSVGAKRYRFDVQEGQWIETQDR